MDALLLSGGLGTRLRPLTDNWPKCLMPVSGRPLIDYWVLNLKLSGYKRVFINTHWHHQIVTNYFRDRDFGIEIVLLHEKTLLGTAGTLRSLMNFRDCGPLLLAHADNFCDISLTELTNFHSKHPDPITMVTFASPNPKECGIVVHDETGTVIKFHEKVSKPPSNLANAAVYIVDQSVIDYVIDNKLINDFSTQVLPEYLKKIKVFKHPITLVDIGSFDRLKFAQSIKSEALDKISNSIPMKPILLAPYMEIVHKLQGN